MTQPHKDVWITATKEGKYRVDYAPVMHKQYPAGTAHRETHELWLTLGIDGQPKFDSAHDAHQWVLDNLKPGYWLNFHRE